MIHLLQSYLHLQIPTQLSAVAGAASPGATLRLLCQLDPLDFVSSDDSGGLAVPGKGDAAAQAAAHKKPRVKIAKRRRVVHPPPELVPLPSSTTLKGLQEAVHAAFSSVYYMFSDFEVLPKSFESPLLL